MKLLTILLMSVLVSSCSSNRANIIDDLKGAGCVLQSLYVDTDMLNIKCLGFSKEMYFIELKKNNPKFIREITGNSKPKEPSY